MVEEKKERVLPHHKKEFDTTKTFKGFAAKEAGLTVSLHEYHPKKIGDDDVEIDVTHNSICHSDLHVMEQSWEVHGFKTSYPVVPGHEIIGKVVKLGKNVKDLKIGSYVGVGAQRGSCQICCDCDDGLEQLCIYSEDTYNPAVGGYGSNVTCNKTFVFAIPKEIEPKYAAPLLCAGITTYSPLAYHKPKAGSEVAILGIGGLGHLGVQFAVAMGYKVTCISRSKDKEELAKKMGAHYFLNSTDKEAMKAARRKFTFILNTVPAEIDWATYLGLLKPFGNLCIVGLSDEEMKLSAAGLVIGNKSISGSGIGGSKDMIEMFAFCAKHNIRPMIEEHDIEFNNDGAKKVNELIQHVADNKARFRVVFKYKK